MYSLDKSTHLIYLSFSLGILISYQSIVMKIWLRMHWSNEFMQWDPNKWGNITLTRVEPGLVWRPDIFLEEDVGQDVTSGLHR